MIELKQASGMDSRTNDQQSSGFLSAFLMTLVPAAAAVCWAVGVSNPVAVLASVFTQ